MDAQHTQPSSADPAAERPARPWLVYLLSLLLVVQAIGLAWVVIQLAPDDMPLSERLVPHTIESFQTLLSSLLVLTAAVALLDALFLWRGSARAWVLAMLVQGIILASGLGLYFRGKPWYVFIMLGFGILMVINLNYENVRAYFLAQAEPHPEAGPQ